MVYRGKPSKSCRQCRNRDIKCDKAKGSCGQCVRAHLTCPGYPDLSKIVFHHETKAVIKRNNVHHSTSYLDAPTRPLLPDLEQRAKEFWVSRYVIGTSAKFQDLKIFWHARPQSQPLAVCVRAVSLAYLSLELQSPEILQRARHRYGSTLLLVNDALKSPNTATNNGTLFTVLLLHLFEKLVQQLCQSPRSPPSHIDGAIAILKLGEPSQFEDVVRLRMFHRLCLGSLLDSMERGVDVPQDLINLHKDVDPRSPYWQLENSCINFISSQKSSRIYESAQRQTSRLIKMLEKALITFGRNQIPTDPTSIHSLH